MTPYINMRQSHAPGPCHSLQSALSYPFSVISPLPLWKAQTAAHTVIIPPTRSLSLSLLPPHWGFLLWLLFVRTKTKPTVRRMFNSDRKWEDTDLSSLSLSLYLAHIHTHTYSKTHTFTVVYKLLQRTLHQLIIIPISSSRLTQPTWILTIITSSITYVVETFLAFCPFKEETSP